MRTGIAQARAAGAAIVDDAVEQNADLIVMGLRYKKRFGGGWDAGRTVPTSCATPPRRSGACALRQRTWHTRHEDHHRRLRTGGSPNRRRARPARRARHRDRHRSAGLQPPAVDLRRRHRARQRRRRGRAALGRRRDVRPADGPDRGRQPQRHGRAARQARVRHPARDRQDQRPGARGGLSVAGPGDDLPHRDPGQRPDQGRRRRRRVRPNGQVLPPTAEPLRGAPVAGSKAAKAGGGSGGGGRDPARRPRADQPTPRRPDSHVRGRDRRRQRRATT